MGMLRAPIRRLGRLSGKQGPQREMFWALKDVTLKVRHGEVLGIIGRNGAGKTTLLKILSRVTRPTEGVAKIYGRVGSLLEVGTGFHPELTGRENIYLSGAVLGMTKREIRHKFDEIVDFSGVERFLETPMKRYSSGMQVRLAFSVAAHLEPEILLVDEVLAVGDARFQRKCLRRMQDVSSQGRTVLLVSHNMGAISAMAARTILLDNGQIEYEGPTESALQLYLERDLAQGHAKLVDHPNRLPGMTPTLISAALKDDAGNVAGAFQQGDNLVLEIRYHDTHQAPLAAVGFAVHDMAGRRVTGFNTWMGKLKLTSEEFPPKGTVRFRLNNCPLCPGSYTISVSVSTTPNVLYDSVGTPLQFFMEQGDFYESGYILSREDGVFALPAECSLEEE